MDKMIKALALNDEVRVYISSTTVLTNEAINRHDLWPSTASLLGKTMTVGLMMGGMLKNNEALTIKLNGNGPVGNVVCDSNAKGEVRGYVDHPHVHFDRKGSLDEVTTLGVDGFLDVIKDLNLKKPFTSSVPLQTGDLAQEFTYYFTLSEQTPSLVSLGCKMNPENTCDVCGGIIIQLMPFASEETISFIESKVSLLSKMSSLLLENSLDDILKMIFENNYHIIETMDVCFKCPCSKEHFAGGILTLGQEEIKDLIDTKGEAEVICHYCGNQYLFNKKDLEEIYEESKKWKKNTL